MSAATPQSGGDATTLKTGALGFASNIVVSLASVAPAYSLAATLAFIVAIDGMGTSAPAILLASFVPILGVAYAFKAFNRVEPDCGTSFAWVTRAVGPRNGWMQGWGIFVADIIVMASLAVIASTHTFLLFGLDSAADSAFWLVVGAIVWTAVMTWVAWRGIELSALVQQLLFIAEVAVIILFAILAFAKMGDLPTSIDPQFSWLNPFTVDVGVLAQGVLLGLFIYWGWDTGVSINEETENSRETPGTAAVLSTFILLAIYLVVGIAAQAYAGLDPLVGAANDDVDIFEAIGPAVMGDLNFLLEIALITSAAASTQTTIMPGARAALSMARREAIPGKFGTIHPKYQTPSFATIFTGVAAIIWTTFLISVSPSGNVLGDSVAAVGFAICFYYGGTALAGVWYFRKVATKNVRHFLELMVLPAVGGFIMFAIFVLAFLEYLPAEANYTTIFGIGAAVVIGIGALGLGIPLMLAAQRRYPQFFRGDTMPSLESYEQNQADPTPLKDPLA